MDSDEFERLWKISGARFGYPVKAAARMTLVRGYRKSDAASFQGADPSAVSKAVRKIAGEPK